MGTGTRRAIAMLLGIAIADVVYLSLAVGGLAFIANIFASVFVVIKIAGALYLAFLAFVAITFLVLFGVLTPFALLASRARGFFTNPAALKRLNRTAVGTMAAIATWTPARA